MIGLKVIEEADRPVQMWHRCFSSLDQIIRFSTSVY